MLILPIDLGPRFWGPECDRQMIRAHVADQPHKRGNPMKRAFAILTIAAAVLLVNALPAAAASRTVTLSNGCTIEMEHRTEKQNGIVKYSARTRGIEGSCGNKIQSCIAFSYNERPTQRVCTKYEALHFDEWGSWVSKSETTGYDVIRSDHNNSNIKGGATGRPWFF